MHYLRGYKIGAIGVLLLMVSMVSAQQNRSGNRNYYDFQSKQYYFGLSLGGNTSSYKVNQSQFFVENDSISIVEGGRGPGFDIHFILNVKIGQYFDFRALPGFSLGNSRSLEFTDANGTMQTRTYESVFVESPFLLRFKSEPYRDKRAFVVAGFKYSYDVQSNSSSRQANTLVKISPHDFAFEIGAGLQFFYPYFIFSPEIKWSRGLGNILIYDDRLAESRVIEQVRSSVFTLSFHFEG